MINSCSDTVNQDPAPKNALDIPLNVTLFENLRGDGLHNTQHSLRQIADMVRNTACDNKDEQPLLKLGTFEGGMSASDITQFSGLMGDHDAGTMHPEEAAERLRGAGIAGVIYTTKRHAPTAPRWRVLVPTSATVGPAEMQTLLDGLNSVLAGTLAGESWHVHQRFYVGHVKGRTPTVIEVEGAAIDTLPDLPRDFPRKIRAQVKPKIEAGDDDLMNEVGRDWTDDEVRDLLSRYPNSAENRWYRNYSPYDYETDTWHLYEDVGLMLNFQYKGNEIGRQLFHDWAMQCPKYDRRQTDHHWKGFRHDKPGPKMKIATLKYRVELHEDLLLQETDPVAWLDNLLESDPANDDHAPDTPLFEDAADWMLTPPEPREWLVRDKLPMGAVSLLTGHGGTGKSLLALQLAVATATGEPWIGLEIEKPGPVVFFSAEDSKNDLKIRLNDICQSSFVEIPQGKLFLQSFIDDDPILADFPKDGRIRTTKLFKRTVEFIDKVKPKLVVLDTLSNLHTGDEVSKQVAVQFINAFKPVASKHNCAVLVLAHPSMSGMESGEFGSRGWHNTVRSRLFLSREKDDKGKETEERKLSTPKQNYGARGEDISLEWRNGVFVEFDDPLEDYDSEFMRMLALFADQGLNVNAASGKNYAPKAFVEHSDCKMRNKKKMKESMDRLMMIGRIRLEHYGPPSKDSKRLVAN